MADSSLILTIAQTDPLQLNSRTGKDALVRVRNHIDGILLGAKRASSAKVFADGSALVSATGGVTYSSSSGTQTVTINGVAITASSGASDALTASAVAAAINASTNALVQYLVTASASGSVVTITSAMPGKVGNCITLAASGTGANASGARLVGGAGGDVTPTTITL